MGIAALLRTGAMAYIWPTLSLDLNSIETGWDWIKDCIQANLGIFHKLYPRLRAESIKAWNSVTNEQVIDLIKLMLARCEALIAARGWHTKY
jgi:hypothetical protein